MKTKESRFQVHDELTAPERSVPILKGALSGGGQLPNFIGVLAGSPAVLRAYARFRSELRNGSLPYATQQRIALARRRAPGQRVRALARSSAPAATPASASTRSRSRASSTPATSSEAVLLRFVKALLESDGAPTAPLARGGARGGLGGRADPRDGRPRGARHLRQPRHARRRRPDRRLDRGLADWPRRLRRRLRGLRCRSMATGAAGTVVVRRETLLLRLSPGRRAVGKRWTGAILFVLMDGPTALLRGQAARARPLRSPAVRAHEGARGRGDRRAPRDRRHCRCGSSTS